MINLILALSGKFYCVHLGRSTWQGYWWEMPAAIKRHARKTGQL